MPLGSTRTTCSPGRVLLPPWPLIPTVPDWTVTKSADRSRMIGDTCQLPATIRTSGLLNLGDCATIDRLKTCRESDVRQFPRSMLRGPMLTEELPLLPTQPFHRSLMQCDQV